MAVGGLLLSIINYNTNDCYHTADDTYNIINRNNFHIPSRIIPQRFVGSTSFPTNVVMVERFTTYFYVRNGQRYANVFSTMLIISLLTKYVNIFNKESNVNIIYVICHYTDLFMNFASYDIYCKCDIMKMKVIIFYIIFQELQDINVLM